MHRFPRTAIPLSVGILLAAVIGCTLGARPEVQDSTALSSRPAETGTATSPAPVIDRPEHGIVEFVELRHHQTDIGLKNPDVDSKEIIAWWDDLEPEEGRYTWERMDQQFDAWEAAGKKIRVRLSTAHDGPFYTPDWVLHKYDIRSVAKGTWVDFETPAPAGVSWGAMADVSDEAGCVVDGTKSLRFDLLDGTGPHTILTYRPQAGFSSGVTYLVDFDYKLTTHSIAGSARFVAEDGQEVASERFELAATDRESCCLRLRSPTRRAVAVELRFDGAGRGALDNVLVTSLVRDPPWRVFKQEDPAPEWELSGGAEWVTDGQGRKAIRLARPGAAVSTSTTSAPFAIGESYQSFYGYRRLKPSRLTHRLTDGSDDYAQQVFDVNKESDQRGVWFDRSVWKPGQRIEIRMENDGEMLIYDVGWRCISSQITVLPDYFSPRFAEKWAGFVTAFARRYGRRPALSTVTVGGFGRWEEVMLDAGPVEAQWRSRGYSQQAYLKRIEDCMRLYRRLLPNIPLQVCLAHGILRQGPESTMTYWNVGRLAVANGVGLKQNGLSERYNAFGQGTARNDVTVMYNWYHGTPGIGFTYETGAQIYNNAYGCHGHPISLLNRALIDGVDSVLLYENDVSQATINQFFMPFVAQAGRPAPTTLFNQVGSFPLRHPRFGNQDYQHLWLGLRHHIAKGAEPVLAIRAGRQCLATREGNTRITWDINAETMFFGMYGAVFSVEYLDEGTDAFTVNAFNKVTGAWEEAARVQKGGTGSWKTATVSGRLMCTENRSGPNEMADVAIDDAGDGVEYVSRVEIQHVPARGFERNVILEHPSAGRSLAVDAAIVRAFTIPADCAMAAVAVQFADVDPISDQVGMRVRVFADGGDNVVGDKRIINPLPGRWYAIPVVPCSGVTSYRLQVDGRAGGIAVSAAGDGSLAMRVEAFTGVDGGQATQVGDAGSTVTVASPFVGLRLRGDGDLTAANVTVHKLVDADGGSLGPCMTAHPVRSGDGSYLIYGEPQTGGRYRIEVAGLQHPVEMTPILLKHAFTPRPAAPHQLDPPVAGPMTAVQTDGQGPEWTLARPVPTTIRQSCRFELTNTTSTSLARIDWWREGDAESRSTYISVVPNDTGSRTYHVNLGLLPGWDGVITRVRVTPALSLYDGGSMTGGAFSIHEVVHGGG